MNKLGLIAIFAATLTACGGKSTDTTDPKTTDKDTTKTADVETPAFPKDRKFDDFANFVAGVEGDASSVLKSLEGSETWKNYKVSLDATWKTTNDKLPIMTDWSKQEINQGAGTLFYPFSGPDFLHADVFFPEHENIIMLALEPLGTFPDMIEKSKTGKDLPYLNGIRNSLNMILGKSFFRTLAMAEDFNGEVDGNLPVLMQFMKRTGHKVLYQEKVGVTADGKLSTDLKNMDASTYFGNRYYFQRDGLEVVRTLTYFSVNLQNMAYGDMPGLDSRKDFQAYLKGSNISSTYLKSASYLMHRETFSTIRNLILDESECVLQDDSGMPVKFFDPAKWNLTFYGDYVFPISLFASRHQDDLKEIYAKGGANVKPLPFGIGYQYVKGTSNLMKAVKK